ncbi:hypothetical protein CFAM422_009504 [Trichoderma lentiforme]|uniref:Uncharacterized protein n=1 Tax=Trichoderma lentiforme TaxID=1567552 RepID=A0A9P5CAF5_9HYPO|nr:hypothetical protein CFAM422_009504 [Trichoderma lentiforme]
MKRRANTSEASSSHLPAKKRRSGSNHGAATRLIWQDSPRGLSADWVYSNNSNVHICNDRRWFTEFTPFKSVTSSGAVEGVGTVSLPVKRDPDMRGPQAHHLLRLTNVLYTPSSDINILGEPLFEIASRLTLRSTPKSRGTLVGEDGNPIAFFSPNAPLYCLRLSGPPVGPRLARTKLEPNGIYAMPVGWDDSERARWNRRGQPDEAEIRPRQWAGQQPYTAKEKAWLKEHYQGEYKFLMSYGLSIYDEEDREEGRAIMRAMVSPDEDDDEDEEDKETEEDEDDEEEEEDEDDDFADYLFDEKELAWIKKHFQNSETFLSSHDLKFYDEEDWPDAKRLIKILMSDDE